MRVSIASPLMQPSPNGRRVGIRIVTFEACSGFTRVMARRIAQPPKVTFVTRLQPSGYPAKPLVSYRTNRQLSGWIPPPLMIRAFGAHGQFRTHAPQQRQYYLATSGGGTVRPSALLWSLVFPGISRRRGYIAKQQV